MTALSRVSINEDIIKFSEASRQILALLSAAAQQCVTITFNRGAMELVITFQRSFKVTPEVLTPFLAGIKEIKGLQLFTSLTLEDQAAGGTWVSW